MTALAPRPAGPLAHAGHTGADLVAYTQVDYTLTDAARIALSESIPASTRRAYEADWKKFLEWCVAAGRVPLPATPETLTSYVTHLTETPNAKRRPFSPSSIERSLTSIRVMHETAGLPKPITKAARKVLSGYRERLALAKDPAALPRKADAAVPDTLRVMLATLDRSTLAGKRDAVLLLLGYATAARVSELAALDIADVRETDDGLLVTVYRRKIKRFTEVAVPYGSNPATCPVRATRALVEALAEAGRTSGPLLVRIDRHGRIAPPLTRGGKQIGDPDGRMTADGIADVVTRIAAAAGLEGRWTGHSLRRGFATAARRAGAALERIGRHGGWADGSRALLGYLEEGDRWTDNPVTGL